MYYDWYSNNIFNQLLSYLECYISYSKSKMYYDQYSNNIFNQSIIFKMWYNWFVVYTFYNNKHFI